MRGRRPGHLVRSSLHRHQPLPTKDRPSPIPSRRPHLSRQPRPRNLQPRLRQQRQPPPRNHSPRQPLKIRRWPMPPESLPRSRLRVRTRTADRSSRHECRRCLRPRHQRFPSQCASRGGLHVLLTGCPFVAGSPSYEQLPVLQVIEPPLTYHVASTATTHWGASGVAQQRLCGRSVGENLKPSPLTHRPGTTRSAWCAFDGGTIHDQGSRPRR